MLTILAFSTGNFLFIVNGLNPGVISTVEPRWAKGLANQYVSYSEVLFHIFYYDWGEENVRYTEVLRYIEVRYIEFRYIEVRYIEIRYIELRYIEARYIEVRYIEVLL